jgi:hypothetical protein
MDRNGDLCFLFHCYIRWQKNRANRSSPIYGRHLRDFGRTCRLHLYLCSAEKLTAVDINGDFPARTAIGPETVIRLWKAADIRRERVLAIYCPGKKSQNNERDGFQCLQLFGGPGPCILGIEENVAIDGSAGSINGPLKLVSCLVPFDEHRVPGYFTGGFQRE